MNPPQLYHFISCNGFAEINNSERGLSVTLADDWPCNSRCGSFSQKSFPPFFCPAPTARTAHEAESELASMDRGGQATF